MNEIEFEVNRDDDPSEVVGQFVGALISLGVLVVVDYGEDKAIVTLKKLDRPLIPCEGE